MLRIRKALKRDSGASAVEYGLLVALIAVVIAVAVFQLGDALNRKFNRSARCVASADASACP